MLSRSKSKLRSIKSANSSVSVDLYENDYVDELMDNEMEKCAQQEEEEEREHFHDLIHEIDADVYTVAMGGIFVEMIFIGLFGGTVLLGSSTVNFDGDDNDGERRRLQPDPGIITSTESPTMTATEAIDENVVDIMELAICTLALSLFIVFVFWVFTKFVTFIQMSRVRSVFITQC